MWPLLFLWNTINNNGYYYPTCPYCGENLHILKKSIKLEFKTPKIAPIGAKDLNLYNITPKIYSKKYATCIKCGAKYDYNEFSLKRHLKALINIPSDRIFLEDILDKELPKYSVDTTYEVIWIETYQEKIKLYYNKPFTFYDQLKRIMSLALRKLWGVNHP